VCGSVINQSRWVQERPGGKHNEVRKREKTRREAEVWAHPGPRVWGAWPLRGNQEAPSQTGGHARCASRNTAFVRAPWVGPPNRASPMRAVVIALGRLRAGAGVCRSWRPTGALPMRALAIVLGACRQACTLRVGRELVWRVALVRRWLARVCAATPQMRPSLVAWRALQTGGPHCTKLHELKRASAPPGPKAV
jgi:hypothetical protein